MPIVAVQLEQKFVSTIFDKSARPKPRTGTAEYVQRLVNPYASIHVSSTIAVWLSLSELEKERHKKNADNEVTKNSNKVKEQQNQEDHAANEPERKRKREEREAREAEAAAAREAEAAVAPAGTIWRSYDGSSRVGVSMFCDGWDTRDLSAQEKEEHHGATMMFRAGVKLQVSSQAICLYKDLFLTDDHLRRGQEFFVKDEQELCSHVLCLCEALPKHAVVHVDPKQCNGFEGGNCFVVGPAIQNLQTPIPGPYLTLK